MYAAILTNKLGPGEVTVAQDDQIIKVTAVDGGGTIEMDKCYPFNYRLSGNLVNVVFHL